MPVQAPPRQLRGTLYCPFCLEQIGNIVRILFTVNNEVVGQFRLWPTRLTAVIDACASPIIRPIVRRNDCLGNFVAGPRSAALRKFHDTFSCLVHMPRAL
jgi:hypothetical protein